MLKALKRAKGAKDVTGQCWRYVVEVVINIYQSESRFLIVKNFQLFQI